MNSIALGRARALAGDLPPAVVWRDCTQDLPEFMRSHLDAYIAEGVGWKFAPLRIFPHGYELSLDNDCILWALPERLRLWLQGGSANACLITEDVRCCYGQFALQCGAEPRNSGIRGLPPRFDPERPLRQLFEENPVVLQSEQDEQGLQVAALSRAAPLLLVRLNEVTICSPFPPHLPNLGSCGAHFVGLNTNRLPWSLEGRPAVEYIREHWRRHRDTLYERIGISPSREVG